MRFVQGVFREVLLRNLPFVRLNKKEAHLSLRKVRIMQARKARGFLALRYLWDLPANSFKAPMREQ